MDVQQKLYDKINIELLTSNVLGCYIYMHELVAFDPTGDPYIHNTVMY